MIRLLALACLLLAAASYLLFGTWWAAPGEDTATHPGGDVSASQAPGLAVTKPPPKDAKAQARRILASLKSLDAAGADAWLTAFKARQPPGTMPYHPDLAAFLAALLGTAGPKLSSHAMHFLQQMGTQAAPFVTSLLTGRVTAARRTAAFAVVEYWHRNGMAFEMPPLLPFLQAQNEHGRRTALLMVGRGVPYEEGLALHLVDLLRQRADSSPFGPGAGLARMGPKGVALLVEMTKADTLRERLAAFYGLGRSRPEDLRPHLPMLSAIIGDAQEDGSARIAAIFALSAMKGDCVECLPALRQALSEDFPECLKSALAVLAPMGPRAADAVSELLPWLDDPDRRVSDSVATVLGKIRSHPGLVLPALAEVIERRGSDAAARALAAFGSEGYALAERILDDGDASAQYSILWTFAQLGERAAPIVPKLIPLIHDEDVHISRRVVGTLGYIGPKAEAAIPAIMRRLAEGEDMLPPRSAAAALARMGTAAEGALSAALRSANKTEVRQAVCVLTHFPFRTAFAIDGLEVLAKSQDARVRAEAVEAIGISIFDPEDPGRIYAPALEAVPPARVRAVMEAAVADADAEVCRRARKFLLWLDIRDGKPVPDFE